MSDAAHPTATVDGKLYRWTNTLQDFECIGDATDEAKTVACARCGDTVPADRAGCASIAECMNFKIPSRGN